MRTAIFVGLLMIADRIGNGKLGDPIIINFIGILMV
jgi:hypothetical protein